MYIRSPRDTLTVARSLAQAHQGGQKEGTEY